MASVVLSLTTPAASSSLRNIQANSETSSSSPSPISPFPCTSLCHIRYPCLSISTTVKPRNYHGCFVVACLPSPQGRTTTSLLTKIYISGLSFRTTEESLRNAFKDFGQLQEVNLVMDRAANRPRGFAFLRYATEVESKKAIEGMHGKVCIAQKTPILCTISDILTPSMCSQFLDGRVIFVEVAKPRSELRQDFKQTPRY